MQPCNCNSAGDGRVRCVARATCYAGMRIHLHSYRNDTLKWVYDKNNKINIWGVSQMNELHGLPTKTTNGDREGIEPHILFH